MIRVAACFLALAFVGGCAPASAPSVRLALEGPPLFVAAEDNAVFSRAVMDRSCMAGFGRMTLHDAQGTVVCDGDMDQPANEKGRLYIHFLCRGGESVSFVMRNLGPDQGMGVGRVHETGERFALFYHPCEDEARRRLAQIKMELAQAQAEQN